MSLLAGMKQGDPLSRLLDTVPRSESRVVVHDWETFEAAMKQPYRIVVLHVDLFADVYPWEWIGLLQERQPTAKVVIVPSEDVYDSLWLEVLHRLAGECGYAVGPLGCGMEEMIRWVRREGFGEGGVPQEQGEAVRAGVVTAVWSAAAKDGATTIAANTGLALARHTPLKVGLLDLNLKNPELRVSLQLRTGNRSNVGLRPKLQTGTLLPSELWEATVPFRKTPNLRILPGTFRRDTASDMTPEMMESLMEVCRSAFDITLVDVSSAPDNAATVCAVRSADYRWLVVQNRASSYLWNWNEWYECYWKYCGLSAENAGFVVNRYDPEGDKLERVGASLGMPLVGVVPNVGGGAGLKAAQEGVPLYDSEHDETFVEAIHGLGSVLTAAVRGEPLPVQAKPRKSRLASLLTGLF